MSLLCSWNQFLSFSPLYARTLPGEALFWPGCAALKLGGGLIERTYGLLKKSVPHLGFSSLCCGKPTFALGTERQKAKRQAQIEKLILNRGMSRVYTLCPNCINTLPRLGIEARSAWPLLADLIGQEGNKNRILTGPYALHDPCGAARHSESQDGARRILTSRGVDWREMAHRREKTLCCGRKNMLFLTNKGAAEQLRAARLEEAQGLPTVTYCESCVEAFRGAGAASVHLLEVLFDEPVKRSQLNRFATPRRCCHA